MAAKAKHTILLVQHGADPRTRTFFDYEAVSLMLDGESSYLQEGGRSSFFRIKPCQRIKPCARGGLA